jgi:hypothetical protein
MSDPEPAKPDLAFVSTGDLIEELMSRSEATLIVRETHPTDQKRDTTYSFDGGISTCIGLAARAQHRLMRIADDAADDADDLPAPSDE